MVNFLSAIVFLAFILLYSEDVSLYIPRDYLQSQFGVIKGLVMLPSS